MARRYTGWSPLGRGRNRRRVDRKRDRRRANPGEEQTDSGGEKGRNPVRNAGPVVLLRLPNCQQPQPLRGNRVAQTSYIPLKS